MPSKVPDCPKTPVVTADTNQIKHFKISLITPMFGGGSTPGVVDLDHQIRLTAIRGQLQFWWRATVGAQYEDLQKLRDAQSAVWGDTSQASRIQVRVDEVCAGIPEPCAKYEQDHNGNGGKFRSIPTWHPPFNNTIALPYALFPFQGKLAKGKNLIEVEPASCIRELSFRLTIIFHKDIEFKKQVEPAIWAWVNFGGLGSRTRRGCGAVHCGELAPYDCTDLVKSWSDFMPKLFPLRMWPTLAASIFTAPNPTDALSAWKLVMDRFRYFRQGVGKGRSQGDQSNRPGRSRYPEPETIRRVTGMRLPKHARIEYIPDDAFPRAEFGLPIVFQFQGKDNGEPYETALYPKNRERMASPLILKPLALKDGKAIPLIVRLQAPLLSGVNLCRGKNSLSLPESTVICDQRLSGYKNSPLVGSKNGSAIEAFLAFASTNPEVFRGVNR